MDVSIYSHALDLWKTTNLPDIQKELDDNVITVKEKETNSIESRKELAVKTKQFKKTYNGNDFFQDYSKLIKLYQKEIDSLTMRSKFSEQFLFKIYSKLSELPDPSPLIINSISLFDNLNKSKENEDKLIELNKKILNFETIEKNLNLNINSLNEKNTFLENEINDSKIENSNLNVKITDLKKQILDSNNNNSTNDESVKIQFLNQELNSSNDEILNLKTNISKLKEKISNWETSNNENELNKKINNLINENKILNITINNEKLENKNSINNLNEKLLEIDTYKNEVTLLRKKLYQLNDYEKIKNELSMLKTIEFNIDSTANDNDDNNNIDSSIISTNKKLQSNLATLRSKNIDLSDNNKKNELLIIDLNKQIDKLKNQNKILETDLNKFDNIDQIFNDNISMISGMTRQMNNRNSNLNNLSPTSSIVGIPEEHQLNSNNLQQQQNSTNNGILSIVSKQRDRFRNKNMELEKKIRNLSSDYQSLQNELASMKDDNIKLYDKIRTINVDPEILGSSNTTTTSSKKVDNSTIKKLLYSKDYYTRKSVNLWDKLFNIFADYVLSNKTTRLSFMIYCLVLHFILFILILVYFNSKAAITTNTAYSNNGPI